MPYHLFVFSSFHIIENLCNTILSRPYHRNVKDEYEMTDHALQIWYVCLIKGIL